MKSLFSILVVSWMMPLAHASPLFNSGVESVSGTPSVLITVLSSPDNLNAVSLCKERLNEAQTKLMRLGATVLVVEECQFYAPDSFGSGGAYSGKVSFIK